MNATLPPVPQASSTKTFVMVVDDHPLIRYAISCAIESAPDLVLCGLAMGYRDALKIFDSIQPEVLVLDLNLKDGDGLSLLQVLSSRGCLPRALVLSVCDEAVYASRALDAGAKGYMMKDEPIEKILRAIRKIAEGHLAFSDRVVSRLLVKDGSQGPAHPLSVLSSRELQVYSYLQKGMPNSEIADLLNISPKTIGTYKNRLMQKLGLVSSRELNEHMKIYGVGL